jgi:hypothetical protein
MHRRPWHRAIAVICAAWTAVALIEPPGVHYCPMHTEHGAVAPDHAAHGVEQPPAGDPAPHGPCLCLGDCAGVTPAVVTSGSVVIDVDVAVVDANPPAPPAHAPVTRGGLTLPFANGPPRAG